MTNNDFMKALNDIDDELITSAKPLADKPIMVKPVKKSHWKSITAAAACAAVVAAGAIAVPKLVKMSALSSRESSGVQSASFGLSEETARVFGKDKNKAYPDDIEFELEEFPDIGFKCSTNGLIMRENDTEKLIGENGEHVTDVFIGDVNADGKREILLNHNDGYMYSRIFDVENGVLYQLNDPSFNCLFIRDDNFGNFDNEETALLSTVCIEAESDIQSGTDTGVISLVYTSPGYPIYGISHVTGSDQDIDDSTMERLFNNELPLTVFKEGLRGKDHDTTDYEQTTYDGKTYYIVDTMTEDGVTFSAGLTKLEYEAGEYVDVLCIVENNSNKDIGMYTPGTGASFNDEISVGIKQGDVQLYHNESYCLQMAIGSTIVKPGEHFAHTFMFDTYEERLDDKDTIVPLCKPIGKYDGGAAMALYKDPYNKSSKLKGYRLKFEVNIVQSDKNSYPHKQKFGIEEFGNGVEFELTSGSLAVNEASDEHTVLFSGMTIENMYLLDLNGDDKREIVANVSSPSNGYKRIAAYDYANKKLYDLCYPGYYDYNMTVLPESDGSRYISVKRIAHQSGETVTMPVPLTLGIMREVTTLSNDKRKPVTSVTEITAFGENFTMEEFPGMTFYLGENSLVLIEDEPFGSLFDGTIDNLYLYDLNGDGCREIVLKGSCKNYNGKYYATIMAIDLVPMSSTGRDIGSMDISFFIKNDALYLSIDGVPDPKPLTYERFK